MANKRDDGHSLGSIPPSKKWNVDHLRPEWINPCGSASWEDFVPALAPTWAGWAHEPRQKNQLRELRGSGFREQHDCSLNPCSLLDGFRRAGVPLCCWMLGKGGPHTQLRRLQ